MQTSTVTVAVIDPSISNFVHSKNDFKIEWYSGTGCGGQHKNKHQNSCRITHIPSGITQTSQTRSRENSLSDAKSKLELLLIDKYRKESESTTALIRKNQVGSGERGDKIRTYRFQDNVVTDHNTGKSAPCDQIMKGRFKLLW